MNIRDNREQEFPCSHVPIVTRMQRKKMTMFSMRVSWTMAHVCGKANRSSSTVLGRVLAAAESTTQKLECNVILRRKPEARQEGEEERATRLSKERDGRRTQSVSSVYVHLNSLSLPLISRHRVYPHTTSRR